VKDLAEYATDGGLWDVLVVLWFLAGIRVLALFGRTPR
jgi:hypothetical protein